MGSNPFANNNEVTDKTKTKRTILDLDVTQHENFNLKNEKGFINLKKIITKFTQKIRYFFVQRH